MATPDTPDLCDPAELVEIIAQQTLQGDPTAATAEQLRAALVKLIDERIEARVAQGRK